MARRYLALAMLASALWGVSYPLTYLALRLFSVNELIMLSYLFSVVLLLIMLMPYGYDGGSIMRGLLLSPINYVLVYLYTELSGGVGGLTALVGSSYIVPLMVIEYASNKCVNVRYVVSAITLLGALYLLFQGYGDSIYVASLLMIMNLAYTVILARIDDVDIINFVLGQSLGTFLISYVMMRNPEVLVLIPNFYYPLMLALIGNVMPNILYVEAIRHIGPVESSLTSSIETISSLIASLPIQQLPTNPVAWALLAVSILSLNAPPGLNRANAQGWAWPMNYYETAQVGEVIPLLRIDAQGGTGLVNPRTKAMVFGKRKII